MVDLNKIMKLDEIEKLDLLDELVNNEVLLEKFIQSVEKNQRRHQLAKRRIEIVNYFKLAVASILAIIIWQTVLFDNSAKLVEDFDKQFDNLKIKNIKILKGDDVL